VSGRRRCGAERGTLLIDECTPAKDTDRGRRVGRANPSQGWERCAAALLVADGLQAATLTIAE